MFLISGQFEISLFEISSRLYFLIHGCTGQYFVSSGSISVCYRHILETGWLDFAICLTIIVVAGD